MITSAEFLKLIQRVEGPTIDFKAAIYDLTREFGGTSLIKDVLSLANTPRDEPAYIVLGINKHADGTNELWGLASHPDEASLQQQFTDKVTPIPEFSYHVVSHNDLQFGVLVMPPNRSGGPFVPMKDVAESFRKGQLYFRRGSRNDHAWRPEDQQFIHSWFATGIVGAVPSEDGPPAWDRFKAAVSDFDPARRYILIASPLRNNSGGALRTFGMVPWVYVLDFDPESEQGGLLAEVREPLDLRVSLHLTVKGERPNLNRDGATYWFFARGLSGRQDTLAEGRWREWKNSYGGELKEQFGRLAKHVNPTPITCVVVWNDTALVKHLNSALEAVVDAFDASVDFVFVCPDPTQIGEIAEDLGSTLVDIPLDQFAAGLQGFLNPARDPADESQIPSSSGAPIPLGKKDQNWLEEELELVDLSTGTILTPGVEPRLRFLRGAEIDWFDLGIHADVNRDKYARIRRQLASDLARRHAVRINIFHGPGAGGSTVARRLLWDFHTEYACAVLKRTTPDETIERLYMLASMTNQSVLLLADSASISDREMDDLFSRARSRQVPVVMLQVLRRFEAHVDRERSFYIPPRLTLPEAVRFAETFSQVVPQKRKQLEKIADTPDDRVCTPFRFGLEAFGEDFLGLERFVAARLDSLESSAVAIMRLLAIAHHYAQQSVRGQAFAGILGVPRDRVVRLERALPEPVLDLVIEVEPGLWRTSHDLIALEILVQTLTAKGGDRRLWKQALSTAAIELIQLCRQDGRVPAAEFLELARRTFIYRDNVDLLGSERSATRDFSQLIWDIPAPEGRLRVLQELVNVFPEEPHFWAHLGRFQALQMRDHEASKTSIDQALSIEPTDPVLHHMRGMAVRHRVDEIMRSDGELEEAVDLAVEAAESFAQARELDPENEHAFISEAQMLIRLLDYAGKRNGGVLSYVALSSAHPFLRGALEQAEDLLERVRRHREGEGASTFERDARARLDSLYGNYARALQTWDNLLARGDVYRPPVRRQIAHTYLARSGRNWAQLPEKETARIVTLLEENLQEEGFAEKDLRLWVQAVRYLSVPPAVETVIERVAYWKSNSGSLEAVYYLYVLHALLALDGSILHRDEAMRSLEECRHLARYRRNRTTSFEWLGIETGLDGLVHHSELGEWVRDANFYEHTDRLARIEGRITTITGPQAGRIEVGGLPAFFVPSTGGFAAGRSENQAVEFYLGFSYDGLRAWDVTLPQPE